MGNINDRFRNSQETSHFDKPTSLNSENVFYPSWSPIPSVRIFTSGPQSSLNVTSPLLELISGKIQTTGSAIYYNYSIPQDFSNILSVSVIALQEYHLGIRVEFHFRTKNNSAYETATKNGNIYKLMLEDLPSKIDLSNVIRFTVEFVTGTVGVFRFTELLSEQKNIIPPLEIFDENNDEIFNYKFVCKCNQLYLKIKFFLYFELNSFLIGYSTSKNLSNSNQLTYKKLYTAKSHKINKVYLPIKKEEKLYVLFKGYIKEISVTQMIVKLTPKTCKKICL